MDVFSIGGRSKPVKVWGPIASVSVKAGGLGSIGGNGSDWLLEGVQVGAKEIVDVRQCFNDVSYIYALGNNQSSCVMSLSFMVFIGTKNCFGDNNTDAIMEGIREYKNSRISQNTSPVVVSIGNFSKKGWLIGIDIGAMDPGKAVCHGVATYMMQLGA